MKDNSKEDGLIDDLISNYKKKLLHYKQILDLTKKQQQAMESEEWQELNQLTSDKERIINKVKELDVKIEQDKKQLTQKSDLKLKTEMRSLKRVVDKAYEVMQRINNLEQANQKKIITKKNKLQKEIKGLDQGISVNQAYDNRNYSSYEGRFIDQKE